MCAIISLMAKQENGSVLPGQETGITQTSLTEQYIIKRPVMTTGMTKESMPSNTSQKPVFEIVLTFAGDCTFGQDDDYLWNRFDSYEKKYGPGYFFEKVADIFHNDDFTFINLEGPLTDSMDINPKEYNFKGRPEYVEIMTLGGIDGVTLANNHSFDYGEKGFIDTKNILDKNGIYHTYYEEAFTVELKGISIAYLGYNAWRHEEASVKNMNKIIPELKKEGVDYIIVNCHWGRELVYYPDEQQKRMARHAIDLGADLVIGHHPHVMQGKEEYKGKTIIYSLGNFCFGGAPHPFDYDTIIYQHKIKTNGEDIIDVSDEIIPARVSGTANLNNYQPVLVSGDEADRIFEKFMTLPMEEEVQNTGE